MQLLVAAAVEDQRLRLDSLPEMFNLRDVEIVIAGFVDVDDARDDVREAAWNQRYRVVTIKINRQACNRAAGKMRAEMLLLLGQHIDAITVTDTEMVNDT